MCLGCGTGNYYTIALSEYVGKVTGLEVNEGMLGRAMDKTATFKNVSLTQGDITKMPFPDNRFDAICCNLVSVLKVISYCYIPYGQKFMWLPLDSQNKKPAQKCRFMILLLPACTW
jgi:16S rRNA A1518/A1519 N6-dimethyltransferase RsmA/KsgA/DIM1 with predicted DNA glycosylase/AP lyase activity